MNSTKLGGAEFLKLPVLGPNGNARDLGMMNRRGKQTISQNTRSNHQLIQGNCSQGRSCWTSRRSPNRNLRLIESEAVCQNFPRFQTDRTGDPAEQPRGRESDRQIINTSVKVGSVPKTSLSYYRASTSEYTISNFRLGASTLDFPEPGRWPVIINI
jgi:hypothetical protein